MLDEGNKSVNGVDRKFTRVFIIFIYILIYWNI